MNNVLLLAQGTHDPSETISYVVMALYIAAFSLFIYGLMGLTGPKTAVRGNWIAATGMAIAVIATLIRIRDTASINWILIVAGLAIGVILGVLAGTGVAIELVRPAIWKKGAGIGKDKGSARKAAQERFPDAADLFARVKDDGRAEAALLARWRAEKGNA